MSKCKSLPPSKMFKREFRACKIGRLTFVPEREIVRSPDESKRVAVFAPLVGKQKPLHLLGYVWKTSRGRALFAPEPCIQYQASTVGAISFFMVKFSAGTIKLGKGGLEGFDDGEDR